MTKMADLTLEERKKRIQRALKDCPVEDAKEIGLDIMAQIVAREVWVKKNNNVFFELTEQMATRADKWAQDNKTVLAFAIAGEKRKNEKEHV